jgi:phage protein U
MQFALLGEIQFELITYFDGLEGRFGSDYAEHALIEGKPRIQWIGDKLDEWTLKLKFHQLYCDPELEVARLQDALELHEPLPFVLATGEYKGEFVVTEISVTSEQTDLVGTLVSVEASVSLKEHVPPPGVGRVSFETPAVQVTGKPSSPQVENVSAGGANAKAPLTEARQSLGQAVGVAMTATSAFRAVTETIAAARQLTGTPQAAMNRLGMAGPQLASVGGSADILCGLLPSVRTVTPGAVPVMTSSRTVANEARNAQTQLAGLAPELLPDCLNALDGNMAVIGRNLEWIGPALTRLAAQVAVRSEPEGIIV